MGWQVIVVGELNIAFKHTKLRGCESCLFLLRLQCISTLPMQGVGVRANLRNSYTTFSPYGSHSCTIPNFIFFLAGFPNSSRRLELQYV